MREDHKEAMEQAAPKTVERVISQKGAMEQAAPRTVERVISQKGIMEQAAPRTVERVVSQKGVMEQAACKSLERVISQKALQMSNSFSCKICVGGFFAGVCVTYLLLAALGSFKTVDFGVLYSASPDPILQNLTSMDVDISGPRSRVSPLKDANRGVDFQISGRLHDDKNVTFLYSAWSAILDRSADENDDLLNRSSMPNAPHLENCKVIAQINQRLDSRGENGSFPPWTAWKGLLGLELLRPAKSSDQQIHPGDPINSEEVNPPWIVGSDEDNIPLTRKVQHDIWIHQHPLNCSDPWVRFLVADWETLPGYGIGAQFAAMCGLLAIAIKEKRVLVTKYFNRADHDGCQGVSRSHWSCYFFPETSTECQNRAFELMEREDAWESGILTRKENYTSKEIWAGQIPRIWGSPWSYFQPTTEIDGSLIIQHRKMDRRWWRAQAVRYLMRFQSEYTCHLLNIARHTSFGLQAARMVLGSLDTGWPEVVVNRPKADVERLVWSEHKPWIPRPILSMHVRMGDKASEMKVVGFKEYMRLADRIRRRFPNLDSIWLSTEMQEVIDETRLYPHWKFYYTNVTRQVGNMSMATYEASLGRKTSTNYPLTNFLMAADADFFIGALGSTWCFLIDGMRNTGGKVMAGYLSVNKDRFW